MSATHGDRPDGPGHALQTTRDPTPPWWPDRYAQGRHWVATQSALTDAGVAVPAGWRHGLFTDWWVWLPEVGAFVYRRGGPPELVCLGDRMLHCVTDASDRYGLSWAGCTLADGERTDGPTFGIDLPAACAWLRAAAFPELGALLWCNPQHVPQPASRP